MKTNDEAEKIYHILEGTNAAQDAIEQVVLLAKNSLDIFDVAVKDRGFNSPLRIETLRKFLLANRANRIRVALHETEGFETRLPRFIMLMQQFSTGIEVRRTTGAAREAQDPLVMADGEHFWHSLHHQHPRSVLTLHSSIDTKPLAERFEQIWENSESGFSAHATGL